MNPTLLEGDIVAWTPVKIEDVEVGDVVVFKSYVHWPEEKIVVHRVSEIQKDSKGNPLLETKGDKNDWTDQAGPHIPEPYIKEDHLMGKVLSIGQQPLKIPFIGYIGILINEGLTSLSQPTSSKESLSYVGIYAPLTISVIILVVLLFILPEKARTIKEKIQLNIFCRKPLNLKKTIITFLIAYVVFLTVIHCFAYDSITGSVGINSASMKSDLDFGKINPGVESPPKNLPVINPSTMPVRGVIFGRGEISEYIIRQSFELERGGSITAKLRAKAASGSKSGSYTGKIMVYSSPFWLIFPNDFIQNLVNWNAEATVFILDFLIAVILATITLLILVSITFVGDRLIIWSINRPLHRPYPLILKKETVKRIIKIKNNTKCALGRGIGWIMRVDFSEIKFKETIFSSVGKPILASLIIFPILFILKDQILAMFIAVLIAGLLAYLITCKIRNKIVLTALIAMVIAILHMIIQSNLIILSNEHSMIEIMALSLGTIGLYLLLLAIILIPLSLISWFVVHQIRNLKEQKDPLLSLEGRCDL